MDHEYESEIDLKDLVFYILYRWRSILLAAIAVCALACGYKAAGDAAQARAENSGGKTGAEREYELALAGYELEKSSYERSITDYQKRLEQQEAYMGESVLMQVDPYNAPTASADIFLKLDASEWAGLPANTSFDPTDSLLSVYTSNFHSAIDWAPLEELTGKGALYLKELVNVSTDYNGNTFTVEVRHSSGSTARQMLDVIVGQILERHEGMGGDVSRHAISITNSTLSYAIDSSLADIQKWNEDTSAAYEQAIVDCRAALERLEEPKRPSGLKKYLVLGFLAGGFLAAVFYGAGYILGGRLHGKHELRDRYGWRLLGVMPRPGKPGPLGGIDRLIQGMEGACRHASADAACRAAAAGIRNLAGCCGSILVTGTADYGKVQKFTERIAPLLKGTTVAAAEDIGLVPDTAREIARYDAVLLVEERHASRLEDIQQEQEYIAAAGRPVAGYVLL